MSVAHRSKRGCPIVCTRIQPSRVRCVSDGADTWLRFRVATRSGAVTDCSMRAALATVRAAANNDPLTSCPRPVRCLDINAARVPTVALNAVVKSTQGT